MDLSTLPPHLRPLMNALVATLRSREPSVRQRVQELRDQNPGATPEQLARTLIRSTRWRVAASGAASGAAAIAPGLGTLISLGAATGQSLYALEQETELVMAIAMLYGHELLDSDERLLEALVVVGIAGGAVKLRENVLVVGGERISIAAFRRLPRAWLMRAGGHVLNTVLGKVAAQRLTASVARAAPLAIGVAVGAGFDWFAVTALGRSAMRYYGREGPAAQADELAALPPASPLPVDTEDRLHVDSGD
ncbi:MAG: hypothetical protein DLM67_07900 [Candidatus Nephthysia bennettiae]|uniref:EcsC family protein n=1 Tax=Candidatus Nephthysia bennettiae TaxID=3127016 RepID=A0A934K041_9BACT|nr:hypothetical protein [Candidatus Dormibacteraeota bacterium]MBJ7611332.1 hypothetical protein [Candidatus Dormibacteraeota bacterium]PZR97468.1 MAG: hypothetical protein DLM67_07900 [Candidatus Dormibacteraeota bacterium]